MTTARFTGSIPALVTPFKDGRVDEAAFAALVERQIASGTHGLVPMGTTGESATVDMAEHLRVVSLCVEVAAGRVPVIAGAGSNRTDVAIALAEGARAAGADAVLVTTPYYNKPSQAGLIAHYTAIADAVDIPLFLYNVPGRSVVDMSHDTVLALARHARIVGIKDATGDLERLPLLLPAAPDFVYLSGDDGTALAYNALGGVGCISVTANVAPALCAEMQNAFLAGDYATARVINARLAPLHKALFSDSSPGPAKYALSRLGLCPPDLRLPLVAPSAASCAQVDAALRHAGLI